MVRSKGLTGLPSLAYKGVEAPTPPNLTIATRVPTASDNENYRIGDLWLNYTPGFPNVGTFSDIFMLIGLERGVARWVNVAPSGVGNILFGEGDVGGPVAPDAAGILFFPGGANMNTEGIPASNQIFIHLNDVIRWPATNAAGTTGAIYLNGTSGGGGTLFMHAFLDNTFLGLDAGNLTMTGTENVAIGDGAGNSFTGALRNVLVGHDAGTFITGGDDNTGVGHLALGSMTTGSGNIAIGRSALLLSSDGFSNVAIGNSALSSTPGAPGAENVAIGTSALADLTDGDNNAAVGTSSLQQITTGSSNIALGSFAGLNLTGSDSNNIMLVDGGTAGDNDTIRIGTQGSHTRAFCAGITGVTVPGTEQNVVIDSVTGQLGVQAIAGANSFFAYLDGDLTAVTGDGTVVAPVILDNELFDTDNIYDTTTGIFTAPIDGIYNFSVVIRFGDLEDLHTSGNVNLFVSSVPNLIDCGTDNPGVRRTITAAGRPDLASYAFSITILLNAADTVHLNVGIGGVSAPKTASILGRPTSGGTGREFFTWWSGHLVVAV